MLLSTEFTAASWMLEPFGEVSSDVAECFSLGIFFLKNAVVKSYHKKVVLKT